LIHAGVGEEQAGGIGHQTGRGNNGVTLGLEKVQKGLSYFNRSHSDAQ
jgi:hypothetical protein